MATSIYNMADTWNDSGTTFTAIKMNVTDTASDAASLLMDLQVGGASKFKVGKTGNVTAAGFIEATNNIISTSWLWGKAGLQIGASGDVKMLRDEANILTLRNGTNAQGFNFYNTYTDASNYERGALKFSSNRLVLDTEELGTGTARGITIGGADLILSSLPTSDPVAAGQLWNNAGVLSVSAGA